MGLNVDPTQRHLLPHAIRFCFHRPIAYDRNA
jgi:hypothetical protein